VNEYWISWYHNPEDGPFELHTPWWISGYTMGDPEKQTIVGGIRAESEEAAYEAVRASYDTPPTELEERFCEQLLEGDRLPWSNPHGRFQLADWMKW
jgi:hypothetical protein